MKEIRNFFSFLWGKNFLNVLEFLLVFLFILFLPGLDYYENLNSFWQKPEVLGFHFSIPPPLPIPKNKLGILPLEFSAKAIFLVDLPTWMPIYQKNPHLRVPPASTAKIMTALVSLDYYRLDDVLTVPNMDFQGQIIKLRAGEKMTVENLLHALLLASANDAAETLAANYPGGRKSFIEKMNQKAKELNLSNTYFTNPTGLDEEGQYTTAFDLALLSRAAIQNEVFTKIVSKKEFLISLVDQKKFYSLRNINILLDKLPGIKGIKTGWTVSAGECLVSFYKKDEREIISVLLGSKDRFGETEKILNWVFENFEWKIPV